MYKLLNNLQNGQTAFYYPEKTNFTNQKFSIQYTSYLQQPINISYIGLYILSFYYAERQSYSINQLQVYFNGIVIDALIDTSTTWAQYINTVNITGTGNLTLFF